MSINSEEAFGVEEFGIKFEDNDGNIVFYLTGGTGSPAGQQAPVPTIYVSNVGEIWKKIGPTATEWVLLKTIDFNLDGGFANAIYQASECVDGGDSNG